MLKVIMTGNLTKQPELRVVQTERGNRSVTSFTVACNGRRENDTTYVRVSVWDALAENCAKYLAKGRKVSCVCNGISTRNYTAQDGSVRTSIETTATDVEFMSPASDRQGDAYEPPVVNAPANDQMTPVAFSDEELPF